MFQLPVGNITAFENSIKRSSRGYEYDILSFSYENSSEKYTLLCDPEHKTTFAYTPPRQTVSHEKFAELYEEGDEVEIAESFEGTLVTFFWNPYIHEWDMCTRNGVGGDYSFVKPIRSLLQNDKGKLIVEAKTYREMVIDTFRNEAMMEGMHLPEYLESLNDVPFLCAGLSTNCSYTCILQHWQNHLVYSPLPPRTVFLNLISIHKHTLIDSVPNVVEIKKNDIDGIWMTACSAFKTPMSKVRTVSSARHLIDDGFLRQEFRKFVSEDEDDQDEALEIIDELDLNDRKLYPPAWILVNKTTGDKIEIENPYYRKAKELRNIQPNLRYQWIDLKLSGKLDAYTRVFTTYNPVFAHFQLEYDEFVDAAYQTYVSYYIMKRKDIFPKKYFIHAAALHHNVYIPSLKAGKKRAIAIDVVNKYFESFSTGKLYYSLAKGF